jgi:hypothetical protein
MLRTGAPEEPSSFLRGRGIYLAFLSLRVGTNACRISYKACCVLELDASVIMMC